MLALPQYISWLKRKQIGQFLRQEGPVSHLNKAKTPTAGGAVFMLVISAVGFIWVITDSAMLLQRSTTSDTVKLLQAYNVAASLVLLLAFACGLIGFFDDVAKINNKANEGLSATLRLRLELLIGLVFGVALLLLTPNSVQQIYSPWGATFSLSPLLYVVLSVFIVAATTNAVNLHDGMDGLSSGTSSLILLTFVLLLTGTGHTGLALIAAVATSSILAFLLFNIYPAKIFMGDTGSLFIGGPAGLALGSGLVVWFIPLTVIYIAETISVILQVTYFKLTKDYKPTKPINGLSVVWLKLTKRLPGEGKRLLRMAPLHHHFEAVMAERGFTEWQVVAGFWLTQLLICIVVLVCFSLSMK